MVEAIGTTELYSCLSKWLEYCLSNGGHSVFDPRTISDGVAISDCLVQLDCQYFNTAWREKIISDTAGNKRLKLNNLKHVQRRILEYYSGTLHISLDKYPAVDIARIAESNNHEDMARLLQLVLGIAIHCDGKEQYIQAIMSMDQEVQHVVMGAIQQLMTLESPSIVAGDDYKELEEQHRQVTAEVSTLRVEKDHLLQKVHELEGTLRGLVEEKSDLFAELENVRSHLKEAQSSLSDSNATKVQQLHRQFEAAKLDKLRLENECDDLKAHARELETRLEEFQQKIQELTAENEQIPILKDSLEEMKYLDSKVKNYETVISQYKKKLEDAQEMRRQMKSLEEKNTAYLQQNMDLEEELRRHSNVSSEVERYKQKLQILEKELAHEKLKLLESTQETEEKGLELEGVRAELMRLQKERDTLQNMALGESLGAYVPQMEILPDTSIPLSANPSYFSPAMSWEVPSSSIDQPDLAFVEAFTPELKEKMAKLEKENEILLRRLEVENPFNTTARSEDVVAKMHVDQLKAESLVTAEKLFSLESSNKELKIQLANLEAIKRSRDAEVEKYKKYLNKAKTIIEGFGDKSKASADNSVEVQSLKTQLIERERQIEKLQKANDQDRLSWAKEEEMILSAWYQLGLKMHQKYSQERIMSQGSFLAQQRQALYKRPPPVVSPAVNTVG